MFKKCGIINCNKELTEEEKDKNKVGNADGTIKCALCNEHFNTLIRQRGFIKISSSIRMGKNIL